jgi:thiol-disulfide isomerase/thioredoxin
VIAAGKQKTNKMKKKTFALLALLMAMIFCMGDVMANTTPQKVTITGKISNYDQTIPFTLLVNRLGMGNESANVIIDNDGNFHASFNIYISSDVWVTYRTNFLVLVNPKDNLSINFDGSTSNRPTLLSTIKFGGDNAKTNQFIAKFQEMYYSNEIYTDWNKKNKAVKELEPEKYLKYNDTIRQIEKSIYKRFVNEYSPNEISRQWASFFIEDGYYSNIAYYPADYITANIKSLPKTWDVPQDYFSKLAERLPIYSSNLKNTYSLNSYASEFLNYVIDKLKTSHQENWGVTFDGRLIAPTAIYDSLKIYNILKYVPDPLLKGIMLTAHFNQQFDKQNIAIYEKYKTIVEKHIKQPFLSIPLYNKYVETKKRINNPELYTRTLLKKVGSSTAKEIFDEIIQSNKGKVIYIDFWATWCSPCLSEMPNSKQIEKELAKRDVTFVYICVDSENDKYMAALSKLQLGGQHYFLSKKQSDEIRKLFQISGIPFYILIDKNGVIKKSGSDLRPLVVKQMIIEILDKK